MGCVGVCWSVACRTLKEKQEITIGIRNRQSYHRIRNFPFGFPLEGGWQGMMLLGKLIAPFNLVSEAVMPPMVIAPCCAADDPDSLPAQSFAT